MGYAVAVVVALVGTVAGLGLFGGSLRTLAPGEDRYRRIDVAGEREIDLEHTGTYTLHAETRDGFSSRRRFETVVPPVVEVRGPDGRLLPVREARLSGGTPYRHGRYRGYRFATFEVDQPGRHVLTVRPRTDDDPPPPTRSTVEARLEPERVALQPAARPGVVAAAVGGAGLVALAWLVALVVGFVTMFRSDRVHLERTRRDRSERQG